MQDCFLKNTKTADGMADNFKVRRTTTQMSANEQQIRAYAKINLTLDIMGKRADGYHELRSVMQSIGLYDLVTVREAESGISLKVSFEEGEERGFSLVPVDEKNLAYRAAKRLLEAAGSDKGAEILLQKRIPVAAGLAGGSTDAAAVLKGVNEVCGLSFTTERLCEVGAKLGADIPFCILGGTALAEGIGEKLTPVSTPKGIYVLLAKPGINVSTAEAYGDFDAAPREEIPAVDTDGMVSTLQKLSEGSKATDPKAASVAAHMGNVLAVVTERKHPLITELKEAFIAEGAVGAMMSGSGPSVYGLFDTQDAAERARAGLKKGYPDIYMTVTELIGR